MAEQVFGASAEPRLRDMPPMRPRNAGITSQLCAGRVAECAGVVDRHDDTHVWRGLEDAWGRAAAETDIA